MKPWMLPVCAAVLAAAIFSSCAPLQVATKVLNDSDLKNAAQAVGEAAMSQPKKSIGHDYTAPGEITRIEIEDEDALIDMQALDVSTVQINYMETESSSYSIQTVGSTLKIEKKAARRDGSERLTITIKVPSSLLDQLKIEGENLEVKLSGLQVGRLEMEAENSLLVLDGLTGSDLSIEAENTVARLSSNLLGRLKVEAENSTLELNQVQADVYDCELENGNLDGTLAGQEADYNIQVRVRNGSSTLTSNSNVSAAKSLRLEVENGNVGLTFQS